MLKEIDSEMRFTDSLEYDDYGRKPIANNIIKLLQSQEVDISPLLIDGEWGTGKTEFCIKLKNLIKDDCSNEFNVIYLNVFEDDYSNQPILSILAEIKELVPKGKMLKKLMNACIPIIKTALKVGVKASINWVSRQDADHIHEDFCKAVESSSNEISDTMIDNLLKSVSKTSSEMETLKQVLQEITRKKEIVFIIDELDRCKPTYAVNLLESIKHLFNIKGIKFILSANSLQLKATINNLYGERVNSDQYFDKFIMFKTALPQLIERNYNTSTASGLHIQEAVGNFNNNNSDISSWCKNFIDTKQHTLRDIERFVIQLKIAAILSKDGVESSFLTKFQIFFISRYIKFFHSKIAEDLCRNEINWLAISKILEIDEKNYLEDSLKLLWLLGLIYNISNNKGIPPSWFEERLIEKAIPEGKDTIKAMTQYLVDPDKEILHQIKRYINII